MTSINIPIGSRKSEWQKVQIYPVFVHNDNIHNEHDDKRSRQRQQLSDYTIVYDGDLCFPDVLIEVVDGDTLWEWTMISLMIHQKIILITMKE